MKPKNPCSFLLLLLILCAASALPAAAAEELKVDLFGGYQYTRIGGPGGVNANGWNAALTGNVNRWFGVTADFSGTYKGVGGISANAYTYTFGPTVTLRNERVSPFAHALFGGFRASAGLGGSSTSTNGFAMLMGGGIDVKATPRVSIRVFQADWIMWRTQGITEKKNARISAGLVFRM